MLVRLIKISGIFSIALIALIFTQAANANPVSSLQKEIQVSFDNLSRDYEESAQDIFEKSSSDLSAKHQDLSDQSTQSTGSLLFSTTRKQTNILIRNNQKISRLVLKTSKKLKALKKEYLSQNENLYKAKVRKTKKRFQAKYDKLQKESATKFAEASQKADIQAASSAASYAEAEASLQAEASGKVVDALSEVSSKYEKDFVKTTNNALGDIERLMNQRKIQSNRKLYKKLKEMKRNLPKREDLLFEAQKALDLSSSTEAVYDLSGQFFLPVTGERVTSQRASEIAKSLCTKINNSLNNADYKKGMALYDWRTVREVRREAFAKEQENIQNLQAKLKELLSQAKSEINRSKTPAERRGAISRFRAAEKKVYADVAKITRNLVITSDGDFLQNKNVFVSNKGFLSVAGFGAVRVSDINQAVREHIKALDNSIIQATKTLEQYEAKGPKGQTVKDVVDSLKEDNKCGTPSFGAAQAGNALGSKIAAEAVDMAVWGGAGCAAGAAVFGAVGGIVGAGAGGVGAVPGAAGAGALGCKVGVWAGPLVYTAFKTITDNKYRKTLWGAAKGTWNITKTTSKKLDTFLKDQRAAFYQNPVKYIKNISSSTAFGVSKAWKNKGAIVRDIGAFGTSFASSAAESAWKSAGNVIKNPIGSLGLSSTETRVISWANEG